MNPFASMAIPSTEIDAPLDSHEETPQVPFGFPESPSLMPYAVSHNQGTPHLDILRGSEDPVEDEEVAGQPEDDSFNNILSRYSNSNASTSNSNRAATPSSRGSGTLTEYQKDISEMEARLGLSPGAITHVIKKESGGDPAALSPSGGAGGLIQFSNETAKSLGVAGGAAEMARMTFEQQLPYVEKFYSRLTRNGTIPMNEKQLRVATFLPTTVGMPGFKKQDPNMVLLDINNDKPSLPGVSKATEKQWYKANQALDKNKDGVITFGDL